MESGCCFGTNKQNMLNTQIDLTPHLSIKRDRVAYTYKLRFKTTYYNNFNTVLHLLYKTKPK